MTARERTDTEIAALVAAENERVAASRARRGRTARLMSRRPTVFVQRAPRAAPVYVGISASRRAVLLAGVAGGSIREMAQAILDDLPPDPHAERHRRELTAEVDAFSAAGRRADLTPWRTPAESRWTDDELRAARQRYTAGVRDPETVQANRAIERVLRRRTRGSRRAEEAPAGGDG